MDRLCKLHNCESDGAVRIIQQHTNRDTILFLCLGAEGFRVEEIPVGKVSGFSSLLFRDEVVFQYREFAPNQYESTIGDHHLGLYYSTILNPASGEELREVRDWLALQIPRFNATLLFEQMPEPPLPF